MTKTKSLPEIVTEVYTLLEALEPQDRQKIIGSVLTLLGETATALPKGNTLLGEEGDGTLPFGPKAQRWLKQNDISVTTIEEVFHRDGDDIEVIASMIPGKGKRGQTHNCYLLTGIQSLLANDEAKFSDSEALKLCKTMGCHDSANHAKNRDELGKNVVGTKTKGFTLPAPGLRTAAALIKEMSTSN